MPIKLLLRNNDNQLDIVDVEGLSDNLDYSHVLFMLSGPDRNWIDAVLKKLIEVHNNVVNDTVPSVIDNNREIFYVYGYFKKNANDTSQDSRWYNAFYIGKGKGERMFSHLGEYKRGFREPKHLRIEENRNGDSNKSNHGRMIKKLYLCEARDPALSELMAFNIEYFLISQAMSVVDADNKVSGNARVNMYKSLCKPYGFDQENNGHESLWKRCVDAFLANPDDTIIDNTFKPSLLFISKNEFCEMVNGLMREYGCDTYDMSNVAENRMGVVLENINNASVSGASDAKLSYVFDGADNIPMRLDLRVSAGGRLTNINLRPRCNNRKYKDEFIKYLNSLKLAQNELNGIEVPDKKIIEIFPPKNDRDYTCLIKNRNKWPYAKPFSYQKSKNDRITYSYWFDVFKPDEKIKCSLNWTNPVDVEVSFIDAIYFLKKCWFNIN